MRGSKPDPLSPQRGEGQGEGWDEEPAHLRLLSWTIKEISFSRYVDSEMALRSGVEPEDAQLLSATAGLREAGGPCDGLSA